MSLGRPGPRSWVLASQIRGVAPGVSKRGRQAPRGPRRAPRSWPLVDSPPTGFLSGGASLLTATLLADPRLRWPQLWATGYGSSSRYERTSKGPSEVSLRADRFPFPIPPARQRSSHWTNVLRPTPTHLNDSAVPRELASDTALTGALDPPAEKGWHLPAALKRLPFAVLLQ